MKSRLAVVLVTISLAAAAVALAQAAGVRKTTLQQQPFPGPVLHTLLIRTVIAHGAEVPPHTHPGVEMAYVASGQALVKIAGRPDQTVGPGGSFSIPQGVVHSVHNAGPGDLTLVSTYVVDKTKPILIPAPGG